MMGDDCIEVVIDTLDEVAQVLKDWDKVREMVGDCEEPNASQEPFVDLVLMIAGHPEAAFKDGLKEGARRWLIEAGVAKRGEFYAD